MGDKRTKRPSVVNVQETLHEEDGTLTSILMSREFEERPRIKTIAETSVYRTEGKSLVVLRVNCTNVYNKAVELWNLVDMYNSDVVIGTESSLNTLRTGLLNYLNARSRGLTFRHRASCI